MRVICIIDAGLSILGAVRDPVVDAVGALDDPVAIALVPVPNIAELLVRARYGASAQWSVASQGHTDHSRGYGEDCEMHG